MSGADELTATAQRFIQNSVGCHSGSTNLLVEMVRCVGVCWLAPIVVLDGEIVGPIKPEQLSDRIAQWSSNGSG
jgi:NADH:ubiquinone oxidoreductase subunit E